MPGAIHSPSSQHKQAARDHELAAYQHRAAAQYHDQRMLHAARLSSRDARPLTAVLAIALALSAITACGEKLQRPASEHGQGYNGQGADRPLHERTLMQGESARMSY